MRARFVTRTVVVNVVTVEMINIHKKADGIQTMKRPISGPFMTPKQCEKYLAKHEPSWIVVDITSVEHYRQTYKCSEADFLSVAEMDGVPTKLGDDGEPLDVE